MSGILKEFVCSQEIENYSNFAGNSKIEKENLTKTNIKNCQESMISQGMKNSATRETSPGLPQIKKRDYIEKWILSNKTNFIQHQRDEDENSWLRNEREAKRVKYEDSGTKENERKSLILEALLVEQENDELLHTRKQRVVQRRDKDFAFMKEAANLSFESPETKRTSKVDAELSVTSSYVTAGQSFVCDEICDEKTKKSASNGERVLCKFLWYKKNRRADEYAKLRRSCVEIKKRNFACLLETPRKSDQTGRSTSTERNVAKSENNSSFERISYENRTNKFKKDEITIAGDHDETIARNVEACRHESHPTKCHTTSPTRSNGYEIEECSDPSEVRSPSLSIGRKLQRLRRRTSKANKTFIVERGMAFSSRIIEAEQIICDSSSSNGSGDLFDDPISDVRNAIKSNHLSVNDKYKNCDSETPLRWNGYETGSKSTKLLRLPYSSPPDNAETVVENSSRAVDRRNDSDVKNHHRKISQSRTLLHSINRVSSIEKDTRTFDAETQIRHESRSVESCAALSLPMIVETEQIIHDSDSSGSPDDPICNDRSSIKSIDSTSTGKRKDWKTCQSETPLRWNGYEMESKSLELPKLSSLQLINTEIMAIRSNSISDEENFSRGADDCCNDSNVKNHPCEISRSCSNLGDVRVSYMMSRETERIEFESLSTHSHEKEDPKIENVIESENEDTVKREYNIDDDSYDSDETYYPGGNPIRHSVSITFSQNESQQIEQFSMNDEMLEKNKSELISQASSPTKNDENPPIRVSAIDSTGNSGKRRKFAKKGTLAAKLESLVSLRVSNLQIWQYQVSHPDYKNSLARFVKLVIRERETRYGRHFLSATILEDSRNLLNHSFGIYDENMKKNEVITVMIVPEISGKIKIRDNDIINIYPPWDIMDQEKRVLSITYFTVVVATEEESKDIPKPLAKAITIVTKFECPCLQRGTIDDTCRIKFTNTKPSFIQSMFESFD